MVRVVRISFDEDGVTAIVVSNRYCVMLENCHLPILDGFFHEYGQDNIWFQQDGAITHTARRSVGTLREVFPWHIVTLRGDIGRMWPDLNLCDFFFWRYLESQVYQNHPQTSKALKGVITQEVTATTPETTRGVKYNNRERLNSVLKMRAEN